MVLENISKELRFKILENEFTNDLMYQASMDTAYHNVVNIEGYAERLRADHRTVIDFCVNHVNSQNENKDL